MQVSINGVSLPELRPRVVLEIEKDGYGFIAETSITLYDRDNEALGKTSTGFKDKVEGDEVSFKSGIQRAVDRLFGGKKKGLFVL